MIKKFSKIIIFFIIIDFFTALNYNRDMDTIVENVSLAEEAYTHPFWFYKDIYVQFSRMYYILDGEAYYEEDGKTIPLEKGHLYLTPVYKKFTLSENANNKLLHTYIHITTNPPITKLIDIDVNTLPLLTEAIAVLRNHIFDGNLKTIKTIVNFILACIPIHNDSNSLANVIKQFINNYPSFDLTAEKISQAVGYSIPHINHTFFTSFKISPIKYFNNKKWAKALELLSSGMSVKEAAMLFNYDSPASFSKAFTVHYGLSPRKYLSALLPPSPPPETIIISD